MRWGRWEEEKGQMGGLRWITGMEMIEAVRETSGWGKVPGVPWGLAFVPNRAFRLELKPGSVVGAGERVRTRRLGLGLDLASKGRNALLGFTMFSSPVLQRANLSPFASLRKTPRSLLQQALNRLLSRRILSSRTGRRRKSLCSR